MIAVSRLPILATLLIGLAVTPTGLEAGPSCSEEYMKCIAAAGLLPEPFRTAADVECAAELIGCIARKLKFW